MNFDIDKVIEKAGKIFDEYKETFQYKNDLDNSDRTNFVNTILGFLDKERNKSITDQQNGKLYIDCRDIISLSENLCSSMLAKFQEKYGIEIYEDMSDEDKQFMARHIFSFIDEIRDDKLAETSYTVKGYIPEIGRYAQPVFFSLTEKKTAIEVAEKLVPYIQKGLLKNDDTLEPIRQILIIQNDGYKGHDGDMGVIETIIWSSTEGKFEIPEIIL